MQSGRRVARSGRVMLASRQRSVKRRTSFSALIGLMIESHLKAIIRNQGNRPRNTWSSTSLTRENLANPSNELLDLSHEQRLDTGTAVTAGGTHPRLETLERSCGPTTEQGKVASAKNADIDSPFKSQAGRFQRRAR